MNDLKGSWQIDTDREWDLRKDQFIPTADPEFLKQHVYAKLPPPWFSLVTLAEMKEERFSFSKEGLSLTGPDGKVETKMFKSFTFVAPDMAIVVTDDNGKESTVRIKRVNAKTISRMARIKILAL